MRENYIPACKSGNIGKGARMSVTVSQPQGAHLVGSVPLDSAEEVFRTAASILGEHLRRLPDGETGARTNWIGWQAGVFQQHPDLEAVPPDPEHYTPLPRLRLRAGVDPGSLSFDSLGYASAALQSYALFSRLKGKGVIPRDCRFQVTFPTPLAPVTSFIDIGSQAAVEPAYERAMLRELDQLLNGVPHDELAIQWDVAVEFGVLEGVWAVPFDNPLEGIVERIVRLSASVPEPVELGYHLCYGDYQHQHFVEPLDTSRLVGLSNRLSATVERSIQWIHLPVPRGRTDDAYYAPLARLDLHPETELYLGLVHFTDGAEGTRQRIEAAQRVVREFGVATECGFGRRPPEQVTTLLEIHRAVAAPVR
jgi:hypothetical protein